MLASIRESAVYAKPEKIKKYLDGKVVFETYLQEAEERNQNKRVYSKSVLTDGLGRVKDKISRRSFLGELDHPITTNQIRQTTVEYKNVCHIIREVGWDGNLIKGVLETTPYTENGKTLSGLILDNVTVGFSLRGLADVQDSGNYQMVMSPLIMIAYDAVSEPSNAKATIQEVKQESFVNIVNESKNLICCDNGKCYLPDFFDQLVESKIINLSDKYQNNWV
jgi:hypothetical protein